MQEIEHCNVRNCLVDQSRIWFQIFSILYGSYETELFFLKEMLDAQLLDFLLHKSWF